MSQGERSATRVECSRVSRETGGTRGQVEKDRTVLLLQPFVEFSLGDRDGGHGRGDEKRDEKGDEKGDGGRAEGDGRLGRLTKKGPAAGSRRTDLEIRRGVMALSHLHNEPISSISVYQRRVYLPLGQTRALERSHWVTPQARQESLGDGARLHSHDEVRHPTSR